MASAQAQSKIVGLSGLIRAMKRYDEKVVIAMKAINLKAAERVAATARALAPRRTGRLADSIKPKALAYAGIVLTGTKAEPYAPPIVYGWPAHNIQANPFPYEALDAERPRVAAEASAAIEALAHETFHGVA